MKKKRVAIKMKIPSIFQNTNNQEDFKDEKVKPALVLKTSSAGFSILDRETTIKKIM